LRREAPRRPGWWGVAALLVAVASVALVYQGLRSEMSAQNAATREELQGIRTELRQIRETLEANDASDGPEEAAPTPAQNTVRFNFGGFPALGNPRATLVMVEFTDFQCPYCARYHATTYGALKKAYVDTQRMRYVTVDFPLDFHALAFKAAEAAHCGDQQGQYWPLHDRLFQSGGRLEPENLLKLAQGLGLNMAAFKACLDGGATADRVRKGLAQGESLGVDGTPTFIIGRAEGSVVRGRMIVGAYPTKVFDDLIQSHLALK
jgi:protein-disulfide isomerase